MINTKWRYCISANFRENSRISCISCQTPFKSKCWAVFSLLRRLEEGHHNLLCNIFSTYYFLVVKATTYFILLEEGENVRYKMYNKLVL